MKLTTALLGIGNIKEFINKIEKNITDEQCAKLMYSKDADIGCIHEILEDVKLIIKYNTNLPERKVIIEKFRTFHYPRHDHSFFFISQPEQVTVLDVVQHNIVTFEKDIKDIFNIVQKYWISDA